MSDENILDTDGPQDLGTDAEGRRIICLHRLATPIRLLGKRNGKLDPDRPLAVADELKFREPTGSDIANYGLPSKLVFHSDEDYTVEFVEAKMTAMMGGLLVSDDEPGIKMALMRKLPSNDWVAIAYELGAFFHTSAADTLTHRCFELALTFHCDPFAILGRPGSLVTTVFDAAGEHLRERAEAAEEQGA